MTIYFCFSQILIAVVMFQESSGRVLRQGAIPSLYSSCVPLVPFHVIPPESNSTASGSISKNETDSTAEKDLPGGKVRQMLF